MVELNGEAYFGIVPDARHPFLINSSGMTVQVLGTEFNLMAYSDEDAIRTTLVSGSVQVQQGNERRQETARSCPLAQARSGRYKAAVPSWKPPTHYFR